MTRPTMQRKAVKALVTVAAVCLTALSPAQVPSQPPLSRQAAATILMHQPLHFERGTGQSFVAGGPGYSLDLAPDSTTIVRRQPAGDSANAPARIELQLLGASTSVRAEPLEPLASTSNYFLGSDPAAWRTGVRQFGRLRYADIYPGIDIVYYGNGSSLEHDFVVSAGADPNRIRLRLESISLNLDTSGDLIAETAAGTVRLLKPVAYQQSGDSRSPVESAYRLDANGDIAFSLGAYDRSRPLIVDPVLSYAVTFGFLDLINGIAVDSAGMIYVTGQAYSPVGITTKNPVLAAGSGTYNAFVTKINPTTNALVFSTYLGGNKADEGFGIALDGLGNVFVTGTTDSTNFPIANAAQTALGTSTSCSTLSSCGTAFVSALKGDGSAILYSTYLGGSTHDAGYAIAADANGSAYVTGLTFSSNFPVRNALYGTSLGGTDAFVTKYNLAGQVQYSTYLGGSGSDAGYGIAVDSTGAVYLTGAASVSFPLKNPVSIGSTVVGNSTSGGVMISKINAAGTALVWSNAVASGTGASIALDGSNNVYVTGSTSQPGVNNNYTPGVPTTTGALNTTSGGSFVFKLSADGSTMVYSTLLGGNATDYANGIAVDSSGDAWVAGYTTSNNFPTVNPIVAEGGGYFYASSNGGATFTAANLGLPASFFQLLFDPNNPGTLTLNGGILYTSTNAGQTWTKITPIGLPTSGIIQIARSKSTPTTIYALAATGMYKSTDNGATYTLSTGTGIPTLTNAVFTVDPFSSTTLYLESASNILYTSTDGGNTWTGSGTTFPANRNVGPVIADPAHQGMLYTTCNSLIWKTTNGGSTWTSLTTSFSPNSLTIDPNNPLTLYAATTFTPFYKSTDGGATWTASSGLAGTSSTVVVDPTNSQNVYVFFNPGLTYLSTNGGSSFTATKFSGLPSIDPTNNQNIYIATGSRNTGFLSELNPTGTALLFSTYAGGTYHSYYEGVALDTTGNAYVGGFTDSKDAPSTTSGVAPSTVEGPTGATHTPVRPKPNGDQPVDLSAVSSGNGTTSGKVEVYDFGPVQTTLKVMDTVNPTSAVIGTDFTYTITVTNTGSLISASNVVADWTAPSTYSSAYQFLVTEGPFACTQQGNTAQCYLHALAPGASAIFTVQVSSNSLGSAYDNITVMASNAPTVTASANTQVLAPSADLAVVIQTPLGNTETYGHLQFSVTVSNYGPQTATPRLFVNGDGTYESIYTYDTSCPGASSNQIVCIFSPLASGTSRTLVGFGSTKSAIGTGTLTAVVSSTVSDPVPSNNTASGTFSIVQAPLAVVIVYNALRALGYAQAADPTGPTSYARPFLSPPQTSGGAIAVDATGNVWGTGSSLITEFDHNRNLLNTFTGGGLSTGGGSTAVAIDGNDTVWIANANNTITQLSNSGTALSPATGYTGGGINAPTGIAIDAAGSVWVTNSGNNTVTHIFGGAAPTVTPISFAAASLTQGTRP